MATTVIERLAQELIDMIESSDIPAGSVGVATEGVGGSIFDPPFIYLQQQPHEQVAYEWTPATDCEVELISDNACVVIDNRDVYTKLAIAGLSIPLRAGTPTKFSAISSTGQLTLKINELV